MTFSLFGYILLLNRKYEGRIKMALRDEWKQAGTGIGHAFKGLGKAFASTAKTAIRKTDEWANGDDAAKAPQSEAEKTEDKSE